MTSPPPSEREESGWFQGCGEGVGGAESVLFPLLLIETCGRLGKVGVWGGEEKRGGKPLWRLLSGLT